LLIFWLILVPQRGVVHDFVIVCVVAFYLLANKMSLVSLSAETYGHGRVIQISPRPGRFAPIGSAFPTAGETVEDTRKNIEYVRQETKRWLASIAYLYDEVIRSHDPMNGYFCRMVSSAGSRSDSSHVYVLPRKRMTLPWTVFERMPKSKTWPSSTEP
jgi:hypothetical protein